MKKSTCFIITIFTISVFLSGSINDLIGQNLSQNSVVLDVSSNRQLFIDHYLIDGTKGKVELEMHHPIPNEIVIKHDKPWEGNSSAYHTVFQDGDLYRMYYRGSQIDIDTLELKISGHPQVYCYAESSDGINWTKPNLGLFEFNGSKENNIILADPMLEGLKMGDNASFFRDDNPDAKPSERYKGFVFSSEPRGLIPIKSNDGIHWEPMSETPVITDGAFDSQNNGFWDSENQEYRAYWRYFHQFVKSENGSIYSGTRAIRTATSKDFIHWENQRDLEYVNSPHEQLYTNQVFPYHRAPQYLIGIPNRYTERWWNYSMVNLPENKNRKLRSSVSDRYGMGITDALLMSSQNGVLFNRWNEAFFRPGIERPGTWNYGHHYVAWGVLETKSNLQGAPNELSFYSAEAYWTGKSNQLRRYTLRMDGFASLSASFEGGEIVTKPFKFDGERLFVNFSTSAAGTIKFEIQDEKGLAIPGFTLNDCPEIFGDNLNREIVWDNNFIPGDLLDKNIRLRIILKDADLYSFQFK